MLSNAAFARTNERFLRRQAGTTAEDVRRARLRAFGLTRADLFWAVMRGMR